VRVVRNVQYEDEAVFVTFLRFGVDAPDVELSVESTVGV
jgi:hypothetical protein